MKTALITGSNKGIGLEVSKQLLTKGYYVFISGRNIEKGNRALKFLREISHNVEFLNIDVESELSIRQAADYFGEHNYNLDILINNAAVLLDNDFILSVSRESLNKTLNINTVGSIMMVQYFLPYIKEYGRIINVSSGWGSILEMRDSPASYSISKAALNAATRLLANCLIEKKISVNSVSPGWVKTDMGGLNADRTVEEGASSIIWLIDKAPQELTNKFLRDGKEINW